MSLQGEVPGIEKADVRARNISLKCACASRQKERIVPAPNGKEGRLVPAEIVLECRVQRDVALVVSNQIQLHLVCAGTREIEVIERLTVRRNVSRIGYAGGVLPVGR